MEHFKCINCTVCELCLNKVLIKKINKASQLMLDWKGVFPCEVIVSAHLLINPKLLVICSCVPLPYMYFRNFSVYFQYIRDSQFILCHGKQKQNEQRLFM